MKCPQHAREELWILWEVEEKPSQMMLQHLFWEENSITAQSGRSMYICACLGIKGKENSFFVLLAVPKGSSSYVTADVT